MNQLVEYLNKYYADSVDGLSEKMSMEFGVDVKQTPSFSSLYLFKYNQLDVKFTRPLPHICRGIIVERTSEGWRLVSYPFDKFFNLHEPFCEIGEEEYCRNHSNFLLTEKADGTCIQLYKYKNKWRVSTLGNIDTRSVGDNELIFEDLFWQTLQKCSGVTKEMLDQILDGYGEHTWLFELCTSSNRIVTKYPESRIYLIGARELSYDSRLLTMGELDLVASLLRVRRPRYFNCSEWKTLEDVKTFVETEGQLGAPEDDSAVEFPEGYVIFLGGKPIAKVKNAIYLTLHSTIGGGNDRCVSRHLAEHFFNESLDDLVPALSEHHLAGIESLKREYGKLKNIFSEVVKRVYEEVDKLDQTDASLNKEYALIVKKNAEQIEGRPGGWLSGFLFRNRQQICEGLLGDVAAHIKHETQRTRDNLNYWRDIVVEGIEHYRENNE